MRKIAVLFPSRFRFEMFTKAYNSWKLNSVCSEAFFGFQENDPQLNQYINFVENEPYVVLGDVGLASKVNQLCAFAGSNYDAYMILNDDQIIHTPEWDRILLDKLDALEAVSGHRFWILHWRDGVQDERLPQSFATKELLSFTKTYNPVGYMRHLFIDNVYKYIGDNCGTLHYMPEIFIQHNHISVTRGVPDRCTRIANRAHGGHTAEQKRYEMWVNDIGKHLVYTLQLEIKKRALTLP